MIECIPIPAFSDNYIWLIHDTTLQRGLIVDPGDAKPVIDYLVQQNIQLDAILITHHHHDHTGGVQNLLKHANVPVYGPKNSQFDLISHTLCENDQINTSVGNLSFKIIETPGHTRDHIAYFDGKRLFCGDTLFLGGCGRLFEGSAEQMLTSLSKLASLPDSTEVYCAHEYTLANLAFAIQLEPDNNTLTDRFAEVTKLRKTSHVSVPALLSLEKATNPFLRAHTDSLKASVEKITQRTLSDSLAVFSAVRTMKDRFNFSEAEFLHQGY